MSNANSASDVNRVLRLATKISMMVMDGSRIACAVAGVLQKIVSHAGKFELAKDLGVITVPPNHCNLTRLAEFRKAHGFRFASISGKITDENFSHPSRPLKAGEKFRVCLFRARTNSAGYVSSFSSEEVLNFLNLCGAVLTGAQGLSLVCEQIGTDFLSSREWAFSYDWEENLPKINPNNPYHEIPALVVVSGKEIHLKVDTYEVDKPHSFFGFFEEE